MGATVDAAAGAGVARGRAIFRGRTDAGDGVDSNGETAAAILSGAADCRDVFTIAWLAVSPRGQRPSCHERIVKVTRKPTLANTTGMIRCRIA